MFCLTVNCSLSVYASRLPATLPAIGGKRGGGRTKRFSRPRRHGNVGTRRRPIAQPSRAAVPGSCARAKTGRRSSSDRRSCGGGIERRSSPKRGTANRRPFGSRGENVDPPLFPPIAAPPQSPHPSPSSISADLAPSTTSRAGAKNGPIAQEERRKTPCPPP